MSADDGSWKRRTLALLWTSLIALDALAVAFVVGADELVFGSLWPLILVALLAAAGASAWLIFRATGSGPEAALAVFPASLGVMGILKMEQAQSLDWLAGFAALAVAVLLVHLLAIWGLYRLRPIETSEA